MKTVILATTMVTLALSPSVAQTWPSGPYKAQLQAHYKCKLDALRAYQRKEISHEEHLYDDQQCTDTIMTKQWLEDYEVAHQ